MLAQRSGEIGDWLTVSQSPVRIRLSRSDGALFADVSPADAGVIDHDHERFCIQRLVAPSRIRLRMSSGEWFPARPGCQVWRPGDHQRSAWRGSSRVQCLFIAPARVREVLDRPAPEWIREGHAIDPATTHFVEAVLDAMALDMIDGKPAGRLVSDVLLVALLERLAANGADVRKDSARAVFAPQTRRRLVDHIDELLHLQRQASLSQLAQFADVSVRHFGRVFKATFGMAPHQYILNRRVEYAKRLLAQGESSLIDVSLDSGFSDQCQFTRVFKRITGETPATYRRVVCHRAG